MAMKPYHTNTRIEQAARTPRTSTIEQAGMADFSAADALRAGIAAGLILGLIIGGTLWTHTPDVTHLGVALAITIFCTIVGGLIGRFVGTIKPETHDHDHA